MTDGLAVSHELLPKPCPFCGYDIGRLLGACTVEGSTFRWVAVECPGCGARGPEVRVQTSGAGNPKEWRRVADLEAIKAWNRIRITAEYEEDEPLDVW